MVARGCFARCGAPPCALGCAAALRFFLLGCSSLGCEAVLFFFVLGCALGCASALRFCNTAPTAADAPTSFLPSTFLFFAAAVSAAKSCLALYFASLHTGKLFRVF